MLGEHLTDEGKQLGQEALEAGKTLLENLRKVGEQIGRSEAGRAINAGITQIELGLMSAKRGLVSDHPYDPTIQLQKVEPTQAAQQQEQPAQSSEQGNAEQKQS